MPEEKDRILDQLLLEDSSGKTSALRQEILNAVDKYLSNVKDPFGKRGLNNAYWSLVSHILKRRLTSLESSQTHFDFTRPEQLALDYGYISEKLVGEVHDFNVEDFDETLVSTSKIDPDIKYFSVTSWLNEQLKEFMGIYEIEKLREAHAKIIASTNDAKRQLEENISAKKQFVSGLKIILPPEIYAKLTVLSDGISQVSNKYSLLKFKIQTGMPLSKEERLELLSIENMLNKTRNERKELLKVNIRFSVDLNALEDKIVTNEVDLLGCVSSIGKSRAELEAFINSKSNISVEKKDSVFSEKVTFLKTMLELVAKRNKVEATAFLTAKAPKRLPDEVFAAIAKFIEADPKVFKNKKVKRFGPPYVIFLPGSGNGVYSYDYNALMIPMFPVKDYRESTISSMVLFRWDCDEEREFRDSYNSLKPYKRLSFVDLQRSLIKDYTLYITKERNGYKVFDKEIRDWFTWQVAPKKDEELKINIQKVDEVRPESGAPVTDLPDAGLESPAGEAKIEQSETAHEPGEAPSEKTENIMITEEIAPAAGNPDEVTGGAAQEPQESRAGTDFLEITETGEETKSEDIIEIDLLGESGPAGENGGAVEITLFDAASEAAPVETASNSGLTPAFEKTRNFFYDKIKSLLRLNNAEEKFIITPSEKQESINIQLIDINVNGPELESILSALSIQLKLRKFNDFFKK